MFIQLIGVDKLKALIGHGNGNSQTRAVGKKSTYIGPITKKSKLIQVRPSSIASRATVQRIRRVEPLHKRLRTDSCILRIQCKQIHLRILRRIRTDALKWSYAG